MVGNANSNPVTATYFTYDGWNLIQEGLERSTGRGLYVHGGRWQMRLWRAGAEVCGISINTMPRATASC